MEFVFIGGRKFFYSDGCIQACGIRKLPGGTYELEEGYTSELEDGGCYWISRDTEAVEPLNERKERRPFYIALDIEVEVEEALKPIYERYKEFIPSYLDIQYKEGLIDLPEVIDLLITYLYEKPS